MVLSGHIYVYYVYLYRYLGLFSAAASKLYKNFPFHKFSIEHVNIDCQMSLLNHNNVH